MKTVIKFIVLIFTFSTLIGCSNKKEQQKITENISKKLIVSDGLLLMQQKCYACHSITSKSHDEIIAPPMVAVKRRYKMSYTNEAEFVEALTSWVMNPEEENALMRGAITNFNIMPKQPFDKDEINSIAQFIYSNTLETPEWFQQHFTDEHPNGMGNGQGNGRNIN